MRLSVSTVPSAQEIEHPERTDFVFYVYVDPLHGDNAQATLDNPTTGQTPHPNMPLSLHPGAPLPHGSGSSKPITGYLQHAPFPFRTLTGENGALAYIEQNFYHPVNLSQRIPWGHPGVTSNPPEPERVVRHIVVQCLPGVYGPTTNAAQETSLIDSRSGLPFNGEVWPARIRDRVSLQGTSALDTIFDGRGHATPILEVRSPALYSEGTSTGRTHWESFIDSIAIRGARASTSAPQHGQGAGIWIHTRIVPENHWETNEEVNITISNCFIYDNLVGIGIDCTANLSPTVSVTMRPRIINNTIAWNRCGIWSGRATEGTPGVGNVNAPTLINNIIDSGAPPGFEYENVGGLTGVSGFEGIAAGDKQVRRLGEVTAPTLIPGLELAGPDGLDFNAWEYGPDGTPQFVNNGLVTEPTIWPATVPPATTIAFLPPKVNLTPYTKNSSGTGPRPGALFVSDILRLAPPQSVPGGYSYSPHDFRLAPHVTKDGTAPGSQQSPELNPLVNKGLDIGDAGLLGLLSSLGLPSPYPIIMASGQRILHEPGLSISSEEVPVHAWDWDGEGFGNPRSHARTGFPVGTLMPEDTRVKGAVIDTRMDLGADEMGELLMAGYIENTRMYSEHPALLINQTMVVYFDLIGGSYPRPLCNLRIGGRNDVNLTTGQYHWFPHKYYGWDRAATTNYTDMPSPFVGNAMFRRIFIPPSAQPYPMPFEIFPRSLECDFGGTLLPDKHPLWPSDLNQFFSADDEYGANPWYGHENSSTYSPLNHDNPALYHNRGGTLHFAGATPIPGWFGYHETWVRDATKQPPGTLIAGTWYLDPFPGMTQFGPFSGCAGGTHYSIGVWGYGDTATNCPEYLPYDPGLSGLGVRWNCQVPAIEQNLQTFLQRVWVGTIAQAQSGTVVETGTLEQNAGRQTREQATEFPSRIWRVVEER